MGEKTISGEITVAEIAGQLTELELVIKKKDEAVIAQAQTIADLEAEVAEAKRILRLGVGIYAIWQIDPDKSPNAMKVFFDQVVKVIEDEPLDSPGPTEKDKA